MYLKINVLYDLTCVPRASTNAITTGTEWLFARETGIATQAEALLLRPASANWTKTMDLYWTRFLTFSERH